MNNKILLDVIAKRNGHYCHALEVNNIYELQAIIENLHDDFTKEYNLDDIIEFFNTIEIYCLDDKNEEEIFSFDIVNFIKNL